MTTENNNYQDIINLTYPQLSNHKRMPIESRAAQFAPFSALTGYKEALTESSRKTIKKQELMPRIANGINHLTSSPPLPPALPTHTNKNRRPNRTSEDIKIM